MKIVEIPFGETQPLENLLPSDVPSTSSTEPRQGTYDGNGCHDSQLQSSEHTAYVTATSDPLADGWTFPSLPCDPWNLPLPADSRARNDEEWQYMSGVMETGWEGGCDCENAAPATQGRPGERMPRAIPTFCQVCNIQLNSATQTQIHMLGKSHRKKLQQSDGANACPLGGFPRLLGAQATILQPAIDLKRILHIPIDLGLLASNLNRMDPVQKAVVTHTFGVPLMPRRRQLFTCNLCQIRFNSEHQASAHFKGNKHSKRLKSLEAGKGRRRRSCVGDRKGGGATSKTKTEPVTNLRCIKKDSENGEVISATRDMNAISRSSLSLTPTRPQECCVVKLTERSVDITKDGESEDAQAQRLLYCSLCKVVVNSRSQLEAHNKGSKHKTMIQARDGGGVIKAFPRLGARPHGPQEIIKTSLQDKTFYCETCDVHVNSESQLKQHITSRRHKDRVAGKPAKPKFCPYNKFLRNPMQLTVKESQKSTLSSPFLATISNAVNLQGALHSSAVPLTAHSLPAPPLSRFFQGQPPIRNAPGVMCTPTRTPMMFTPY